MITKKLGTKAGLPSEVARAIPDSKQGETPGQLQEFATNLSTVFTRIGGTQILHAADRWVIAKLTLQTAGPVDVGTRAELTPVLSGKGRSLVTNQELAIPLAKGTRLYYTAAATNRLLVVIEPIPWLQQIALEIVAVGNAIVAALVALASRPATKTTPATSSSGKTASEIPCPPPSRSFLPKLRRGK